MAYWRTTGASVSAELPESQESTSKPSKSPLMSMEHRVFRHERQASIVREAKRPGLTNLRRQRAGQHATSCGRADDAGDVSRRDRDVAYGFVERIGDEKIAEPIER